MSNFHIRLFVARLLEQTSRNYYHFLFHLTRKMRRIYLKMQNMFFLNFTFRSLSLPLSRCLHVPTLAGGAHIFNGAFCVQIQQLQLCARVYCLFLWPLFPTYFLCKCVYRALAHTFSGWLLLFFFNITFIMFYLLLLLFVWGATALLARCTGKL